MYEKYFGLTERPFDLAPDPRFLFLTDAHARAVANLKFALTNHDTFVILSGEIGIGKTTVLNTVLDELGGGYETARLTHTTLDNIELLQALLSEFGKPMYTRKRVLLLDTLRDVFLEKHRQRSHVVIIVDEAQKLSAEALEELRLLSCIDSHDRRIVTILLTGSTELDDVVDSPNLVQLRQRVRLRQRLECLNEEETDAYIRHRLEIVGGDMDAIFEPEAIREIHRLATGTPRLINTLCDTALMACCVEEKPTVTTEIIDETVRELGWEWFEEGGPNREVNQSAPQLNQPSQTPTLIVYRGGRLIDQVEVSQFPFLIGRSHANDLVVIDKNVSRRHALIDHVGGVYIIEDLHSKNGIILNGIRQTRGLLRDGDVFTLGQIDIAFSSKPESGDSTGPDQDDAETLDETSDPGETRADLADILEGAEDELIEAAEDFEEQERKYV